MRRLTPGMVSKSSTSAPKRAITRSISLESVAMASSKKSSLARICPTMRAWWVLKRPSRAKRSRATWPGAGPGPARRGPLGPWSPRRGPRACRARTCPRCLKPPKSKFDAGVLEHLVEALGLSASLFDLGLAIAGEVAQLADLFGRHEARAHQAVLDELTDPLGVAHVGLSSRDITQVPGVQDPALGDVLEDVEHRFPIDAGRLHPDQGDPEGDDPVPQGQQIGRHRPERGGGLLSFPSFPRRAHAGDDGVFVDVETAAALDHSVHGSSSPGPRLRRRSRGSPGRSLVSMDSDPRARGNSSVLPRLPRPTIQRARAHHFFSDVARATPHTVFIRCARPRQGPG